jgi:ABC-type sugar transport system permease subunit
MRTHHPLTPWLFISPFILAFTVFFIFPVIYGFTQSLTNQIGFGEINFVGLRNYVRVITEDARFWKSIWNAIQLFLFGSMASIVTLSFILAHIATAPSLGMGKRPFITVLFTPNITSVVVIGIVFGFLLKTNGGVINQLLAPFGIEPIQWLRDPAFALPSMIILVTWRYVGINTLYVMAGMQSIPRELYEAAKIEGASALRQFFSITLPLLRPMMEFIVFQAVLGTFAIFGEPFILVGGRGTQDSMLYPAYYLYDTSIRSMRFGYASAIAFTLASILLILTFIQRRAWKVRRQT